MKKVISVILCTLLAMALWVVIAFIGTVDGWWHSPIAKKGDESFRAAIDKELEKQFVGNFALAIMKDGEVEYEKFHSAGKPVTRNTVFQVSSLSKWISAFGVMRLFEEGKLDLDAPVGTYLTRWQLPPSQFNNDEVTIRRLLSHTAGITDGLGYSGFEPGTRVQTLEESLTKASDADEGRSGAVRVGRKPGSGFKYSGGGYTLVQLVVEEVSDQTFASHMQHAVFEPLNMIHSSYNREDSSAYPLAEFYNADGTRAKHYRYTALAATSLYTTLSDLELFFQAHLAGKSGEPIGRGALDPESVKMMRVPHGRMQGVDIWGLGTVLYAVTDNGDFIIGHDGKSTPPINTAVRLNPETGDGIIILSTGSPVIATRIASEWVFWKTGKVDTLLFQLSSKSMFRTMGIGCLVILGLVTVLALKFGGSRS